MTMPRTSRADRRREGLLPPGEDPIRPLGPRPVAGPPPAGGRRRTDRDPGAAPGLPPATGERRRPPAAQTPPPSAGDLPTQLSPLARPAQPAPQVRPAPSGPMTSVAAAGSSAAGRPVPPPARRDDVPPARRSSAPGTEAARTDPARTDAARTDPARTDAARTDPGPVTTGMPLWAAAAAAPAHLPLDVTQRVSGAVPAESAWGAASAAPVAVTPARAPQDPPSPARAVAAGPETAEPTAEPETETDLVADPAPERRRVDVPVGGRAALRLERQAAEAARKKAGGRRTAPSARPEPAASGPGRDADADEQPRRTSRRVVQGLVALVLVAGGVLGFWSYTSPRTQDASTQTPASAAGASTSAAAPVQESVPPSAPVAPAPVGPVRAPVTVLNSTSINGLAGDVGDQFAGGGWEVAGTGPSPVEDVATTTVYYTEGDTTQQQAATQLVEQFPDVFGPVPRYFEVPDVPAPGLVVVVTGNWQP